MSEESSDRLLGELSANVQRVLDGQEEIKSVFIRHENGPHQEIRNLLTLHDNRINAHGKQLAYIKGGVAVIGTSATIVWASVKGWFTAHW